MNANDDAEDFDFLGPGELETMENNWRTGKLQPVVKRVLRFVEQHRDTIIQMAGGQDPTSLLKATRRLIQETGSLEPVAEAREQIREINNEIWYEGQRGNIDPLNVPIKWIELHAANWRKWKDKEYLFTVIRCRAEVLKRLIDGKSG